jgi:arginase family enzyme
MLITFDTNAIYRDLLEGGFTPTQAEAVVHAIKQAQTELVTKDDLKTALYHLKYELVIMLGGITFASFGLFAGLLTYILRSV